MNKITCICQFPSLNSGQSVSINCHVDCSSRNVVYLITCTKCKKQLVGHTQRTLAEAFTEHVNIVSNKITNQPTGRHFTLPGTIQWAQLKVSADLPFVVKYGPKFLWNIIFFSFFNLNNTHINSSIVFLVTHSDHCIFFIFLNNVNLNSLAFNFGFLNVTLSYPLLLQSSSSKFDYGWYK